MHLPYKTIGALLVGVLLGVIGTVALYKSAITPETPKDQETGAAEFVKLRSGSSFPEKIGIARYTNPFYGFSLQYPIELTQREFSEGGGAMTVLFQLPNEEKGFQMFIVPYAESQISQERIRSDLAGAPMKNITNIVLPGGIQAVHFESQAPIIGESSEVWFIHNGYLYEVTTYKALDSWLAGILATLTFTK